MGLRLRVVDPGDCSVSEGEIRVCTGSTYAIGRAADNDWVLQDAARYISKHHCRIEQTDDGYRIVDISTNGVYLGESSVAIGRGNSQPVSNGDFLNLGSCVVCFEIREEEAPLGPAEPDGDAKTNGFAPPLDAAWSGAPGLQSRTGLPVFESIGRRGVADAEFGRNEGDALDGTPLPLHEPAEHPSPVQSFFPIPQLRRPAIPLDWQADPPTEADQAELFSREVGFRPAAAEPREELRPAALDPRSVEDPIGGDAPPPKVSGHLHLAADGAPVAAGGYDQRLVEAFLEGAALPADVFDMSDAAATMREIGQAFRDAVGGIRDLLETRAMLKAEFRMEHTRAQARDNNPLKFSTNLEGALAVMLGRRVPGFMGCSEAIRESLRDIKAHEIAIMAGLCAALANQLEQLAPAKVRAQLEKSGAGGILPTGKKARLWEHYEQLHEQVSSEEMAAGSIGRQFVEAYSDQYRKI